MSNFTINEKDFENIMKGVSNACAKDDARANLQYMKFVVSEGEMKVYALNGYIASKIVVPYRSEFGVETAFYIKPFKFKASKGGRRDVVIETGEKYVSVTVTAEYGMLTYHFTQPIPWTINIEEIFTKAKVHDREVAVNAALMIRALKSILDTSIDVNKLAIIESRPNMNSAFIVRARREGFSNEQLVLPIRLD